MERSFAGHQEQRWCEPLQALDYTDAVGVMPKKIDYHRLSQMANKMKIKMKNQLKTRALGCEQAENRLPVHPYPDFSRV
ncbi:hypothetical protein ACFL03_15520 [Thermodesulfobacteriota bacterium]